MNIQLTKFNKALFKMQYKSYYTDQDIDILNEYRTVPNIVFFQQRPNKVKLCEIDVSKAYTSALTLITKVPIFNEFDSFQPYDMHGIRDMHLYIIKVQSLSLFFQQRFKFMLWYVFETTKRF